MTTTSPTYDFAELNGTNFYYEVAGAGHPLVLVHAGICDSRMWDDQFAHFAEHYRVARYDARGYGQTKPVEGSFAYRDDLHALLTYLGIERAHLVGCSFGGTTCLDFALAYPEMVERLVLVDATPSGYQSAQPLPAQLAAVDAAAEAGDFEQAAELEVQIWVDGPMRSAHEVPPAIRQKVHAMNLIALHNEALDLGQPVPLDPPAAQRLQALQAATLLVVGALDQPRTREAIDWMASQIPNAQKSVIEHAAHLPNMEKPAEFNRIVLEFLGIEAKGIDG